MKSMFTLEAIQEAHSQVKSGADFPSYIAAIKALGVKHYEVWVADGRVEYVSGQDARLCSKEKYPRLAVAEVSDGEKFRNLLKLHQAWETDYPTFCRDAALSGIEKWRVDTEAMTCTYFDRQGKEIFIESIPYNH